MPEHGTYSGYTGGCRCEYCGAAAAEYHRSQQVPLPPDDPRHGKPGTYRNYGCRCDLCRDVANKVQRELRARRRTEAEPDPSIQHGTRSSYSAGCRCKDCRAAAAEYHRMRRQTVLAPDDPRHGSPSTYRNYGCRCDLCRERTNADQRAQRAQRRAEGLPGSNRCRCDDCRAANAARERARRAANLLTGLPEGHPAHGTANGYTHHGCRCKPCTAAKTESKRKPKPKHTVTNYLNDGCRCPDCVGAWQAYQERLSRWKRNET